MAEPFSCDFTVECRAGSGCATLEAPVEFDVIAADHEGQLFFRFPFSAAAADRLSMPGSFPAQYTALMALLTILEDGTAAYSKHIGVERLEALSYLGVCGEL